MRPYRIGKALFFLGASQAGVERVLSTGRETATEASLVYIEKPRNTCIKSVVYCTPLSPQRQFLHMLMGMVGEEEEVVVLKLEEGDQMFCERGGGVQGARRAGMVREAARFRGEEVHDNACIFA